MTFTSRDHMLNCLLDEMLKTRRRGETATQFAARLHPEELRTLYWLRKMREYAEANELRPGRRSVSDDWGPPPPGEVENCARCAAFRLRRPDATPEEVTVVHALNCRPHPWEPVR